MAGGVTLIQGSAQLFDPEKRVIVKNVFRYMVGTNSEDSVNDPAGSERVVGRSQILRGPTEKERFCDAPLGNMPIAGIVQGESDGREGAFIMFCPPTTVLELRNLEEIRCEDLGDTVSGRMNVLGGSFSMNTFTGTGLCIDLEIITSETTKIFETMHL